MPSSPCSLPVDTSRWMSTTGGVSACPFTTATTVPLWLATYNAGSPLRCTTASGLSSPDTIGVSFTCTAARLGLPVVAVVRGLLDVVVSFATVVVGGRGGSLVDAALPLLLLHAAANSTDITTTAQIRVRRMAVHATEW